MQEPLAIQIAFKIFSTISAAIKLHQVWAVFSVVAHFRRTSVSTSRSLTSFYTYISAFRTTGNRTTVKRK